MKQFHYFQQNNESQIKAILQNYPVVLISYSDCLHAEKLLKLFGPSEHIEKIKEDILEKLKEIVIIP